MTIVHVHGGLVPGGAEGISRNVESLAAALQARGNRVRVDARQVHLQELNRRRRLLAAGNDAGHLVRAAARDPTTDAVHLHVPLALLGALARVQPRREAPPRILHVWNAHLEGDAPVPWRDALPHRLANGPLASRLGLRGWPDIVVSSQHQARQMERLSPAGRVHVLPNGVDTRLFAPAGPARQEEARRILGLRGDPVLLYCGHGSAWKGVDVLLDALPGFLRAVPGSEAILAITPYGQGHARARERLAKMPEAHRVHLHGLSHVPTLLAAADLVALPLLDAVGTTCHPNLLLEAMAAGVPVVASRVGSVPEVLEHGRNGLLVQPGDAARLRATLQGLAGDARRRRELGVQARLDVEPLDWDPVAQRFEELYRRLGVDLPAPRPAAPQTVPPVPPVAP